MPLLPPRPGPPPVARMREEGLASGPTSASGFPSFASHAERTRSRRRDGREAGRSLSSLPEKADTGVSSEHLLRTAAPCGAGQPDSGESSQGAYQPGRQSGGMPDVGPRYKVSRSKHFFQEDLMTKRLLGLCCLVLGVACPVIAQTNNSKDPTWWSKYQYILNNGSDPAPGTTSSVGVGANVDV